MSEDAKAAIQDDVNAYYDMFIRAVARNRNASLKSVRERFRARPHGSRRASVIEAGHGHDRTGTMRDTLSRLGVDMSGGASPQNSRKATGRKVSVLRRELELLQN